ncbi:putative zinc transporter msc2 [Agyrium rufum]|nr:putative zinc transporter msc2 [Agyrium rufum]
MDRRHGKPVAPLNLKQSNYGFSEVSIKGPSLEEGHGLTPERKESNHWELRNITSELISSVLIPIPYLLGSLTRTASLLDPENPIDPSQMGVITDLLWTARVSSLALLITGIVAKNGQKRIESNSRNATLGHAKEKEDSMKSLLSPSKAGLFGQRILQMGLPFYACTQLGGVAVAEVQLVALAGDLYSATKKLHEDKSSLNTWKYLILSKKWAIAAIIMQAFSKSIPGLANTTLQEIILGYSTLVLGILFFPPPFPSSIHNRGAANGSVPEDQPKQRLSLRNRSYSAVQTSTTTFYAVVTGSLGLLSDSIHMLFDCLALVVGLCAAVMSKWPPSTRFPYGFGKMDTLAGFANGVFLMLISVEIIYEAVERLVEGSQMQRIGELLTVSSLGLVVNLVGITAFGHAHHGHGHSHDHGHDHAEAHQHEHESHRHHDHHHDHNHEYEHSHHSHGNGHVHEENRPPGSLTQSVPNTGNGSISPLPFSIPSTPSILTAPQSAAPQAPSQSHKSHSHGHHHHGNENMHGIFLHILADTLGSVAVVISSILIEYTGWSGFDPLASCLIAILIFASAVPLVTSSARILLLTVPDSTEFDLREALAGVGSLRGVVGVRAPRFWMSDGNDQVIGVMHVIAGRGIELDDVRERASRFLKDRSMDILIQVEREGDGRCWCGGGA